MVDIVSLVVQSKKALQQAEQLCSNANHLINESSQIAIDILALDAKVRWITEGVLEQFKVAASVAKSLEDQRVKLLAEAREWDEQRAHHTTALDGVLDACGTQFVPPSFYQTPTADEESLFITPEGDEPVETASDDDRSKWKSLREFIDERAIEEAVEKIDEDRNHLDDLLFTTSHFPRILTSQIEAMQRNLQEPPTLPSLETLFASQEAASTSMAGHLNSLTVHYDQMNNALKDKESGHELSDADMEVLIHDTEELPGIISELEQSSQDISGVNAQLHSLKSTCATALSTLSVTVSQLEHLEPTIEGMLADQRDVELEASTIQNALHAHLQSLESLQQTYTSYYLAYSKLLLELERRMRYREATEKMLSRVLTQLESMREEEMRDRELFFVEHGSYLPEDLCLFVGNVPPRWEVASAREELPTLSESTLEEARRNIDALEGRYMQD